MEAVRDFLPFQDTDQAAGQAGYASGAGVPVWLLVWRLLLRRFGAWARRRWRTRRSGDSGPRPASPARWRNCPGRWSICSSSRPLPWTAPGERPWPRRPAGPGTRAGPPAGGRLPAAVPPGPPPDTAAAFGPRTRRALREPLKCQVPRTGQITPAIPVPPVRGRPGAADDSAPPMPPMPPMPPCADAAGDADAAGPRMLPVMRRRWMTGIGIPRSSCGPGYGSAPRRRGAGSPSPRTLLPRTGFGGQQVLPAAREELGAAVASAEVASRAASIITVALDRVRHVCDPETAARMEHALTRTAAENDPDFLVRVARSWTDAIDQDGAEPSEELLRQLQGAFIRKPRHGLHHLEIFATAEQFEHLLTVMNTATNPRTTSPAGSSPAADPAEPAEPAEPAAGRHAAELRPRAAPLAEAVPDTAAGQRSAGASAAAAGWRVSAPADARLRMGMGLRPALPLRLPGVGSARGPGPAHAAAENARRPGRGLQGCPRRRVPARRRRTPPAGHGHHRLPRPPRPGSTTPHTTRRIAPAGIAAAGRNSHGSRRRRSLRAAGRTHRDAAVHRPRHRLDRPEDRLRRRHHPGPARRRRPDPGHRPDLQDLPAPHPQSPHRPRPGLRLPRLHHPRALVRGPPHHLLVPRRHHRHGQRNPALFPPPPPDPQGTMDHPAPHRGPLVHPAPTPRPPPTTPPQHTTSTPPSTPPDHLSADDVTRDWLSEWPRKCRPAIHGDRPADSASVKRAAERTSPSDSW